MNNLTWQKFVVLYGVLEATAVVTTPVIYSTVVVIIIIITIKIHLSRLLKVAHRFSYGTTFKTRP